MTMKTTKVSLLAITESLAEVLHGLKPSHPTKFFMWEEIVDEIRIEFEVCYGDIFDSTYFTDTCYYGESGC